MQLITDPAIILATITEADKAKGEAKDYADEIVGNLDKNIQQVIADAITAAKRDFWEDDNRLAPPAFLTRTQSQ